MGVFLICTLHTQCTHVDTAYSYRCSDDIQGNYCVWWLGSPYSINQRRVPELMPVLGSQPAGDFRHKPNGRLPLLSARPAVTPTTLKTAVTNFAAW